MKPGYSLEQSNWLRNNFRAYDNYADITIAFNAFFEEEKTTVSIQNKCVNLGLFVKQSVEEEIEWISQQKQLGLKYPDILKKYRSVYGKARPDDKVFELYKKAKGNDGDSKKMPLRTFKARWKASGGRNGRCLYLSRYDAGSVANAEDAKRFLRGAYIGIKDFKVEKICEI